MLKESTSGTEGFKKPVKSRKISTFKLELVHITSVKGSLLERIYYCLCFLVEGHR